MKSAKNLEKLKELYRPKGEGFPALGMHGPPSPLMIGNIEIILS